MGLISGITNSVRNIFRRFIPNKMFLNGQDISWFSLGGNIADNETVFSAISLLANSLSSVPIHLYNNYNRVYSNQNYNAKLVDFAPNLYMTPFQFIRCMEVCRNTKGNAYALKIYDRRMQCIGLEVMDPDKVEPIIEKDTKDLWYRVNDEQGITYVHNSNIIHVNHIFSMGYKGANPIDILNNTINYDREVKEFSINQMQNGLKANIVIKLASKLNEEALRNYEDMLKRFKKSGVLYLDSGKDIQELNNNNFIDPKVFEVEKITIERVARVFNIPLSKLLNEKQSYSSSEQADLEYIKHTILPIVRMYELEFNKKLLTEEEISQGYAFKFNLNGLARGDMQTRGDFYQKGIRSAWFTPNEVRSLEELPPKPGGDSILISRDLIPIEKIDDLIPTLKGGEKSE